MCSQEAPCPAFCLLRLFQAWSPVACEPWCLLSLVFVRRHVWGVDVWSSHSFTYAAVCVGLLSYEHATTHTCVFPPVGCLGYFHVRSL